MSSFKIRDKSVYLIDGDNNEMNNDYRGGGGCANGDGGAEDDNDDDFGEMFNDVVIKPSTLLNGRLFVTVNKMFAILSKYVN